MPLKIRSSSLLLPANGNASIPCVGNVIIIKADSQYFNGVRIIIVSATNFSEVAKIDSQGSWDGFMDISYTSSNNSLVFTNKASYNLNLPYIVLG